MAERRLIVNADDFGMSTQATDAIVDCHLRGILTSTTVMANMPAVAEACEKARSLERLGVGVHLTLTQGRPLLPPGEVPDLVGTDGAFLPVEVQATRFWFRRGLADQVERELAAQMERVLALGVAVTHCDSHHNVHKAPVVRAAMVRAMRRFGIERARTHVGDFWTGPHAALADRLRCALGRARRLPKRAVYRLVHWQLHAAGVRTPDRKLARSMLVPRVDDAKQQMLACLAALPEGVSEIVFHPGPREPDDPPHFASVREQDYAVLCDPGVREAVARHGIRLISYRDI